MVTNTTKAMIKSTFLIIERANGHTEYININYILIISHTKTQNHQEGLSIKFVTGAIMTIVLKDSEIKSILKQLC